MKSLYLKSKHTFDLITWIIWDVMVFDMYTFLGMLSSFSFCFSFTFYYFLFVFIFLYLCLQEKADALIILRGYLIGFTSLEII